MKSTIEHEPIIHNGQEYEPVAFRAPKPGEWFVRNHTFEPEKACVNFCEPRLILRPKHNWHGLRGWWAKDKDGDVYWFARKPMMHKDQFWYGEEDWSCVPANIMAAINPLYVPPQIDDWTVCVESPHNNEVTK